jgi:hypothetical protein
MTDDSPQASVIPYRGEWNVILRDTTSNSLVLLNRKSRQLTLHRDGVSTSPVVCPTCRRELPNDNPSLGSPSFRDVNYFSMLAESASTSREHSRPSSPARDFSRAPGINKTSFTEGYFDRFFVSEGQIGRGGKGMVFKVRHVLDGVGLGVYACKKIPVGNNHECRFLYGRSLR